VELLATVLWWQHRSWQKLLWVGCLAGSLLTLELCDLEMVQAQQHAPVWDSYLSQVSLAKLTRSDLQIDLRYIKNGGPGKQTHAQMDLYLYRAADEAKILEIAGRVEGLDKTQTERPMFLDVLLGEGLVVRVGRGVAERQLSQQRAAAGDEDATGRVARLGPLPAPEAAIQDRSFAYQFDLGAAGLIQQATQLRQFVVPEPSDTLWRRHYDDRLKLLAFVPVNDCKYATDVPAACRQYDDFPWDPKFPYGGNPSPIQLLKPLPFEFELVELRDGGFRLLVH
jgi:hypothetical protein